jgi:hypothetical protein
MLVVLACDSNGRTKTWKLEGEIPQLQISLGETPEKSLDTDQIPANLQDPEFLAAWNDWKSFRKKNRWTTKPAFLEQKLKTFSEWGPDLSAEAMRNSIEQGYQGVFKPNCFTRRKAIPKAMKADIPELKLNGGVPF